MDDDQGSWTEIDRLVSLVVLGVLVMSQNVSANHQEGKMAEPFGALFQGV